MSTMVTIIRLRQSDQELHAMIEVKPNQKPWCLVLFMLVLPLLK